MSNQKTVTSPAQLVSEQLKRDSVAVLLIFLLAGVALITWGHILEYGWTHLNILVTHAGIALIAGAGVGLAFDLLLIRSFLRAISSTLQSETAQTISAMKEELDGRSEGQKKLANQGIGSAEASFSVREYVKALEKRHPSTTQESGPVRMLNSFVFAKKGTAFLISAALKQGREVRILLGNPSCPFVRSRISEIAPTPGKADTNVAGEAFVGMMKLLRYQDVKDAIENGQFRVAFYDGAPTVPMWGVGDDFTVSWFLKGVTSIDIPQICVQAKPVLNDPLQASSLLGNCLKNHFESVWGSATELARDQYFSDAPQFPPCKTDFRPLPKVDVDAPSAEAAQPQAS